MAEVPGTAPAALPDPGDDPLWFQRAVFYEVFTRGFHDADGDGVGDIPGLIGKLDYLAWLGVDCLWLLPFYPSPLRDGGYDISDYFSVHPDSGTVEDVRTLLREAHARGIRVIADLVIDEETRDVWRGDRFIELTATEYKLLHYLAANARRVLTREQILAAVWDYTFTSNASVLDTYVSYLRHKIDLDGLPPLIHTVRGVGYSLRLAPGQE